MRPQVLGAGQPAPRPLPHSPAAALAEIRAGNVEVSLAGAGGDPQWREVYDAMLRADPSLFAKELLGIEIGPHMLEWADLIVDHRRVALIAARDHSKSTFFSYVYPIWRAWSDPGQELYLFSNTLEQARDLLDIIVYGKSNLRGLINTPELTHLVPHEEAVRRDRRLRLNRSEVRLTNGFRIRAVGWRKAIRGRHPRYIVLDDVLNDEDLFSELVRTKNIIYFKTAITNMLPPDGQLVAVGTPYHIADLWGFLRENKRYVFKRYPGIIRDEVTKEERALFPWRWPLEMLKGKLEEIGSVAFAREIMCEPITDDMSIFPSTLFPPLYDKTMRCQPSADEIEANGWTVFMGVDIARSASTAADYFVIFVLARDGHGNHFVLDIIRTKGLPFIRQMEEIAHVANRYTASLIYIEENVLQQVYTDEIRRQTDLPIRGFKTTAQNKYPLDRGVPGLRILLENKKLTIPRGDANSCAITDPWISEMTMFGYVDGKLQGIGEHDDTVMALWFAVEASRAGGFTFAFGDEDKETDEVEGPDGAGERWEDVLLGVPEERDEGGFGT